MTPLEGFIGGAYSLPSKSISAQRCVNLVVEGVPSNDKSPAILTGTPGCSAFTGFPYSGDFGYAQKNVRAGGLYVTSTGILILLRNNRLYAYESIVNGVLVPHVTYGNVGTAHNSADGLFAILDFIHEPGYGSVTMLDNGVVLFVSTGYQNAVYQYDIATLLGGFINSWPYSGFQQIDYIGSLFVIATLDAAHPTSIINQKIRVSPPDWNGDASLWDALAQATPDLAPDALVGFAVLGPDVFVFGTETMEVWQDTGATPMALEANSNMGQAIGCGATLSIAKSENSVFWLGSGKNGHQKIYQTKGYSPVVISTTALEIEIGSYPSTDDAVGSTYQKDGHAFYVLTFQSGNKTWQYDISTGLWSELTSTNSNADQERSRYLGFVSFQGEIIGLDRMQDGPVLLSNTVYTECGLPIVRVRTSPHVHANLNRVFFNRFQLDMQPAGDGGAADPQIRLRWSNDGGYSWSNFMFRSIGKIGQYAKRVIWNRLGQSRSRTWEVSISEPVPIRIANAWIDGEEGDN